MRKLKIAFIYPTDPLGPKVGGPETFMKGFIKYAPEDFNIEFIGVSSNREKRPPNRRIRLKLGNTGFNFFPLFAEKDENKKTLIPLSLRFTIALKFSTEKFEEKVLFFNRIEPAILFRKVKAPKIAVIHRDIQKMLQTESEVFWRRLPLLYLMFEKSVFTSLDHIYTVSSKTLEFYRSRYPEQKDKFSFLPTWVDPEIFYPSDEPKGKARQNCLLTSKQLPLKGRWILFVGRLQKVKSPIRLVRTFAEYNKTDKKSCLLIIGKGNLEQQVKSYVTKLGLGNSVYFLGSKSQEELAEYYKAADLMLLTSNFEGMPMSVLEALGSGLPVVSTNVGEVKRLIKNGFSGEVVESFSPEIISRSVEKVLENPNIYSKDNCIKSVSEYTPRKVLKPAYEMMRELSNERYAITKMSKVNICNVKIDNVSVQDTINIIESFIEKGGQYYAVTPNIDHIVILQKDSEFRKIYDGASLTLPDGMPLLWAAKFLGTPLKEKISGSDLFPRLCAFAAEKEYKLFFLGGRPCAALKAADALKVKHPGIRIVGIYSPPFGFENDRIEEKKIAELIKNAKPDIIFVGLGAPKQEKWIFKYCRELNVPLSIGIGVSFEFVSGMVKRAPRWMQKAGLEWLWRLLMEPKRLWKRYLINDMKFFWLVLKQRLGQGRK